MIFVLLFATIYLITVFATVATSMLLLLTRPSILISNAFSVTYSLQLYGLGEILLRPIQAFLEWSGKNRSAIALCLDLRATLHSARNQYVEAEGLHKRALILYRQLLQDSVKEDVIQPFVIAAEDYASLLEITSRNSEAAAILTETARVLENYHFDDKAQVLYLRARKLTE